MSRKKIENQLTTSQKYFAYINKNLNEIKGSSSGGAFLSIVKIIFSLHENVVVYGCEMKYKPNIHAEITRSYKYQDCLKFSGSKYIAGDIKNVFKYIDEDVNNGMYIVISGLPCQLSAIRNYLKIKKYNEDRFFFIDLICHGTGNVDFFENFVSLLSKKYNSEIIQYKFRDKNQGWKGYPSYVKFINGKELKNTLILRNFPILYLNGYIIRKSCFSCQFSNLNRVGDITLGDCWGIEASEGKIDTKYGVSLIISNSDKSEQVLSFISQYGYIKEIAKETVISNQQNLVNGHKPPKEYDQFWNLYKNKGIKKVLKKYGSMNVRQFVRFYLKKFAIKFHLYKI